MNKHLFSGCATALITPFTENGKDVDFEFYEKLLQWQAEEHADAVVIAGTTGESPVLTATEKQQLFSEAVLAVGRQIPVIAGTGSNNTIEAVRKANEAEKEGVDGLLIVTPFYNKCTQEGLVRHYHFIADRVSTPIIVYNVPSRTGMNILPETYAALAEHPRIVGIKEANGDLSSAAKTMALCSENIDLYSGNDDQTVSMMAIGAKGVISVASNIIPSVMHRITELAASNDFHNAAKCQNEYVSLMNLLFSEVNPIPIKAGIEVMFHIKQYLRLPLTEMTNKNKKLLYKEMKLRNLI